MRTDRHTDTQTDTHTRDNYCNPRCSCAPRVNKVLQDNTTASRKAFKRQQRLVKTAVDKATEEWMSKVVDDAETAKKDGHLCWKCIRQLQMVHAGRKPKRPTTLITSNGELT